MNLLKLLLCFLASLCLLNATPQEATPQNHQDNQTTLILKDSTTQQNDIESMPNLPLKSDLGIDMWRYVVVLLLMVVLVIVLWILKRGLYKQPFKNLLSANKSPNDEDKIRIIASQYIDSKHQILTIETHNRRYLILIGANAPLLLDSYQIPQKDTPQKAT